MLCQFVFYCLSQFTKVVSSSGPLVVGLLDLRVATESDENHRSVQCERLGDSSVC